MGGLEWVEDPRRAEVIVVNTCAFIQAAVEESLDTIMEMARLKQDGCCKKLIVAGCLAPRYGQELVAELPEVDLFVGPAEVNELGAWLAGRLPGNKFTCRPGHACLATADVPRVNSLSAGAAYLKVAEGCSRNCSFCIIPSLRGALKSRELVDLVAEAGKLVELGVKEIVLVAQDTTSWGRDLPGNEDLADLVEAVSGVDGLRWLRLMYLFPASVTERLVEVIAGSENVLAYLDVPIQHADRQVLAGMRRGPAEMGPLFGMLREKIAGVVLRTSVMTGFPSETEDAFCRLRDFVVEHRFERLGAFAFSPEEGSPAALLQGQVPPDVAQGRQEELLARQQEIALGYHEGLVDETLEVIVEGRNAEGSLFGRAWNQAPEIDGQTIIRGGAEPGEIVLARVIDAGPYDLEVEVVE